MLPKPCSLASSLLLGSALVGAAATFTYRADLTADQVVADPAISSSATATAIMTLTTGGTGGPTLSYQIEFNGLDVSETVPRPTLSGPDSLIRAIHVHIGPVGGGGPHALNIYGFPREDDADLVVSESEALVSGLWDDGDENFNGDGTRDAGDSISLTNALTDLQSGNLYIQVHTMLHRGGEIRGQILLVPEPTSLSLLVLSALPLLSRRRLR